MTKLVLSEDSASLLRQVANESGSDHKAIASLRDALTDQPEQAKMTAQSPAVPDATTTDTPARMVLDHSLLISVASWARSDDRLRKDDAARLKLSSLVTNSTVYIPPKPVFQRSKELEESLAAIQRAQEEAEYQRITSATPSAATSYKIPSSYVNISGVDPTLPLSQRFSSQAGTSNKLMAQREEQAWKDAQRQLSVILNIFLSTLATATAAWWASGHASAGHKVLVSMLAAVVTALAEVVLYSRYQVYVNESKHIKQGRMKGSDVTKAFDGTERFKPLQFRTSSQTKASDGNSNAKTDRAPS